jgi:hypothetical protein
MKPKTKKPATNRAWKSPTTESIGPEFNQKQTWKIAVRDFPQYNAVLREGHAFISVCGRVTGAA